MEELITSLKEKVQESLKTNEKLAKESKVSSEKFQNAINSLETTKNELNTKLLE